MPLRVLKRPNEIVEGHVPCLPPLLLRLGRDEARFRSRPHIARRQPEFPPEGAAEICCVAETELLRDRRDRLVAAGSPKAARLSTSLWRRMYRVTPP